MVDTIDLMRVYSDQLDSLERQRIRLCNQRQSLVSDTIIGDKGGWFGKALPEDSEPVAAQDMLIESIELLEKQALKELISVFSTHPLHTWQQEQKGVGEKQLARLLCVIPDLSEFPNPAKLWKYCGYAPGQVRRKGVQSTWSPRAKSRAYLICDSAAVKHRHPVYREIYDKRKESTRETHPDWTDGHRDNDARRVATKAILKDMWSAYRSTTDPL
jgi:transposase